MRKPLCLLTTIIMLMLYVGGANASLDKWYQRNSMVTENLNSVAFGSNIFVAVGDKGRLITSPDGVKWTLRNSSTSTELTDILFANGMFVAVGTNGTILKSIDGINWEVKRTGTEWFTAIAVGNGQYVVTAKYPGQIYVSSDINAWTRVYDGGYSALEDVAYGNGKFIAVASLYNGVSLKSVDGIIWTPVNLKPPLFGITYGAERFVAVGSDYGAYVSFDGENWQSTSVIGSKITFGNGQYVTLSNGGVNAINYSKDANTWSSFVTNNQYVNNAVYGNGTFVAVGNNGYVSQSLDLLLYGINYPPEKPVLVGPSNNATDIGAKTTFTWNKAIDPNGDAVNYTLYISESSLFETNVTQVISNINSSTAKQDTSNGPNGKMFALFGSCSVMLGGLYRRKTKSYLKYLLPFVVAITLCSCGGGSGSNTATQNNQTTTSANQVVNTVQLKDNTVYYWKVVADDGKGATEESTVWSFKTKGVL